MDKRINRIAVEALVDDIHKLLCTIGSASYAGATRISCFSLLGAEVTRFKAIGSVRTAETYQATLSSFSRYRNGKDLCVDELDSDILKGYEAWMRHRGLTRNTIAFYMKRLRAAYNYGMRKHHYADRHPFDEVFTGREETRKRAVPISTMKEIAHFAAATRRQAFARDLFLFSFMAQGMSFVDMALLKKSNVRNGHIIYNRRKTGQQLDVVLSMEMQTIISRYPSTNGFLLPIIKRQNDRERGQLRYVQMWVNKELTKMGKQIDPDLHLTMYCARHSWATIARDINIPISVISCGLGHTNERTTRIYLRSIDMAVIGRANASVIRAVME